MAERSILWTTGGAGDGSAQYTMDDLTKWMRDLLVRDTPGSYYVLKGVANELLVAVSGGNVTVATGAGIVYGYPYYNTATVNVTVGTPVVGTTGYRVVLRADWTARTVRIALLSGTDGSATIPSLTQNPGSVFEVSLATFTKTTAGVITLTDTRAYTQFSTHLGTNAVHSTTVLANNIVDDTKISNRVPVMAKRRGGSATDWSVAGTTNYDLTQVKTYVSVASVTVNAGNKSAQVVVSLPDNYYVQTPTALVSIQDSGAGGTTTEVATATVSFVVANSVTVLVTRPNPSSTASSWSGIITVLSLGYGGV